MKHLWIVRAGLALLLLWAMNAPGQTAGHPLRIALVVDGPWERNGEIFQAFDGILHEVLGSGVDVRIVDGRMQEADWTLAGVRKLNTRLLVDPGVDLIVAMGVIASQDLATRGSLPKPVIAGLVIDPARQNIPLTRGTSGVKNLSYLVFPSTFKRAIAFFQTVVPFKHLVLISSKRYDQVLPSAPPGLEEMLKSMGVSVTLVSVDSSAAELFNSIPPDAEAVYLEPTLHMPPREFSKMVQGFIDRRLPSFSLMGESDVRQGIMAGA